jgi:hypothetical protein
MRELRACHASSYEALSKLSKRVRNSNVPLRDLLSGNRWPTAETLTKRRRFLRRRRNGIVPATESNRMSGCNRIIRPLRYLLYVRLCPFCCKARGEIRGITRNRSQGVCPKCGASGPARERQQEALRAWNRAKNLKASEYLMNNAPVVLTHKHLHRSRVLKNGTSRWSSANGFMISSN